MSNWQRIKLSDCCLSIADGDHQAPPKATSGIPFITISNMTKDHQLDFSNTLFVPPEYYAGIDPKRKAKQGDILYSVVGSFGIPIFINDDKAFAFQRHIAILRPAPEKVIPRFLFYEMLSRDFYAQADAAAIGAAQRTISISALRNMEINLPSLARQKKIVAILATYDDLIDNNKRQIGLLEEAAARLYNEYFVRLHFPGYEHTELIDGLPAGWQRQRLIDIADVQYGYAFDGSLFNNDKKGIPIVRIRNIPSGTTNDYTTEEAPEQYIVNNGDILVGMDGEFHINSWQGEKSYLVQRSCNITPKNELMRGWLLQAIYQPIKNFEHAIVGATVAHLGKKHIDTIELLTGPENLYVPFNDLFHQKQILAKQNNLLAEARDRLLPRLLSGELDG